MGSIRLKVLFAAFACVVLLVTTPRAESAAHEEEDNQQEENSLECPDGTSGLRTRGDGDGSRRSVKFKSQIDEELELFWVDAAGREVAQGRIMPLSETVRESYAGHVFRVRWADRPEVIVTETVVPRGVVHHSKNQGSPQQQQHEVVVVPCGVLVERAKEIRSTERDEESFHHQCATFAALLHDVEAPCVGPSKSWSCVRYLSIEDLAQRDPTAYGLQPNETRRGREFQTVDSGYVSQIGKIPKVTDGPGYLKMSFTQKLKDILVDWYALRRNDSIISHGVIPGGYTNNDKVPFDKVNLDRFPEIHAAIVREMRHVLQYWTNLKLKHTSTFGVRIYRRDSCLINHVDRMDTHLASAVLQISQDADEGWPLELYLPNQRVAEVYLQPQEMVLYEGAWLRHGRPMRFKGREFANVFSHFAPVDWSGPHNTQTSPAASLYYGIPHDRLTTLADDPGVLTSDYFLHHHDYHRSRESSSSAAGGGDHMSGSSSSQGEL